MSFRLRFSETANGLLKHPFLPSPSYNLLLSPSFTLLQERAEKCSCQSSCNVKFRRFDDLSLWHIMLDNSLLHHETGPLKTHEMYCSSPKCDWLSHRGLVAINTTAIYRELFFFSFFDNRVCCALWSKKKSHFLWENSNNKTRRSYF